RMHSPPPRDAEMNDWHVDEAEDADHRRKPRRLAARLSEAADHQVAGVDDPEHQRRGEARVPRPERAADRLRPDHPPDESRGGEDESYQGACTRKPVAGRVLLPEIDDAPDQDDREALVRGDRRAHVEIEA